LKNWRIEESDITDESGDWLSDSIFGLYQDKNGGLYPGCFRSLDWI